ncbi:F420-dependent oxidoreductase [Streptomyces griseoflavus]|uniref:LLM class F420-dependent oxidoreductase n=1 Tax=Streptomyces rimosus TaxID=1927 RepID=UPI0004CA4550|nr:LLM class F420-dependent oxidoreductase [Streptomyces rimosus]KOG66148.1 F420-dependent oxidoreductase [Streptomyces griseoflavus]
MKIGVNILNYGADTTPEGIETWVRGAEELGYHLAMISDHVTQPPEVADAFPAPFYDPFTTLAWLAGRTTTIELGTTVVVLPYRHPLQTARVTANLDRFSGGRLVFGVGIGWSRQEYEALGIDFAARGRITDEYLTCIKEHWTQPVVSFRGEHAAYSGITTGPAPVRRPHPPVWVGGLSDAALRRAGRFGDAWHPYTLDADTIRRRLPVLEAAAEAAGRPTPAVTPRIALHLTERPVDAASRLPGHGSVDQVRADLAALAELDVPYVVLDTFLTSYAGPVPPEESPRHDLAQLETAAERIFDLPGETLR